MVRMLVEISSWHGSKSFIISLDMVYDDDKTNFLTDWHLYGLV